MSGFCISGAFIDPPDHTELIDCEEDGCKGQGEWIGHCEVEGNVFCCMECGREWFEPFDDLLDEEVDKYDIALSLKELGEGYHGEF